MLVLVLPPGRVFWRSSSAPSAPAETNTSAIRVPVDALGRVRLLSRLVDRAKGIFAALTHSLMLSCGRQNAATCGMLLDLVG